MPSDALEECLRCDKKFCVHCRAHGFCEDCIEQMGLIEQNIQESIEQQEKSNVGGVITWTDHERGIREGLQLALKVAKGEEWK
jgi:hypothetical protein